MQMVIVIVFMLVVILAAMAFVIFAIFSPAVEFKKDIDFKPCSKERDHVHNRID